MLYHISLYTLASKKSLYHIGLNTLTWKTTKLSKKIVDEMGVDEMGVDEMGVDEMEVDEMGIDTRFCLIILCTV